MKISFHKCQFLRDPFTYMGLTVMLKIKTSLYIHERQVQCNNQYETVQANGRM